MERDLPAYGDPSALAEIGRRFGYAFEPLSARAKGYYYKPVLQAEAIDGPFIVAGIDVVPFVQDHGYSTTLGFRFGAFAYSTDVVQLGEAAFVALAGIGKIGRAHVRTPVTNAHLVCR